MDFINDDDEDFESQHVYKQDCDLPKGLMVTGIVGAIVSVMLTAPVFAVAFIGLWSTGAVASFTDRDCCIPKRSKHS